MRRKYIERELKNEADRLTPDPIDKIKLAARAEKLLPYESEQKSEVYTRDGTAVLAKRKRATIGLFAAFASAAVCLALVFTFIPYFGKNDRPFTPPTRANLSTEDVYGMGAVSSVRLLGSDLSASAVKSMFSINATNDATDDSSESEVKRQAKRFNEYFTALDSFLGDDIISTSTETNTDDRYPYRLKMTITGIDLSGNTMSYIMYYTETSDDSDDDDDEADDRETENEYRLVGVMVIDGIDYHLEGERSEETEDDESETELRIRAYADMTDKTSYIQMEQEYSVENGETETEYVYSIYANGELVEQTAVEFETENKNNKIETAYELEFRSGMSKGKYIVEREEKDSRVSIKVKYDIYDKSGVFHIREITDENNNKKYEYTFDDNEIIVFR